MAFVIENGVLKQYLPEEEVTTVIIPEDVTIIGESAFENHTEIKDVELNDGIVEIRKNAFRYTGIEKVKVPDSLVVLGENAFVYRKKGQYYWDNNDGFAELKFSKKHKVYHTDGKSLLKFNEDGTDTLILCFKKGITSYDIPAGVTVIKNNAFRYCTKLAGITLPDSMIALEDDAFINTKVAALYLPASVSYVGNNPHRWYDTGKYGQKEHVQIVPDTNNPVFFAENDCLYEKAPDGSVVLVSWENPKNKTVVIREDTTIIGNRAFENGFVESLTLPNGVITIGERAFQSCGKLKKINIPQNVKSIGKYAFSSCPKLKKLSLPGSLEDVADTIVDGSCAIELDPACENLKMLDGIIYDSDFTTVKLVTSSAAKKPCIVIPDSVSDIGTAFAGKVLKKLVLGAGIKEINKNAFLVASISVLELPADVKLTDSQIFTTKFDLEYCEAPDDNCFMQIVVPAGSYAEQQIIPLAKDEKTLIAIKYKKDEENKELSDWSYIFEEGKACILKYLGDSTDVTIPESIQGVPVNAIFTAAFAGKNVENVIIPDTVTSIGKEAFAYCGKMKNIKLPESLVNLGSGAFGCCSALEKIVIPDGVQEILEETFYGCDALASITLPDSIIFIDNHWVSTTEHWEKAELRKWEEAYTNTPLKIVVEKDSYADRFLEKYINEYQPSGEIVSRLTIIKINGADSETDKESLAENIDSQMPDAYFDYKEVEDNDVKRYGAIPGTIKITGIKSPDENGVVVLPEKINGVDVTFYGAFSYYGTPIKKMMIPKSLVALKSAEDFPEVEDELIIDPENPTWTTDGVSLLSKDGTSLLRMCQKNRTAYTVPDGVIKICSNAFKWNKVVELTIPDTVTTVESGAFAYCDTLTTVNGGKNITDYTLGSFKDTPWYKNSKSLIFGTTLLRWDSSDKKVVIPEGIEIIGENAFGDESSVAMEEVVLPSSLKTLGKNAFYGKRNLKKITLPEGLVTISQGAFRGCKSLAEITIPESVTKIGRGAFQNCAELKEINFRHSFAGYKDTLLGTTVTENTISAEMFAGCSSLETINIPSGVAIIDTNAFENCSLLKDITLPDTVTAIKQGAFSGCMNLKCLTLPKNLSEIGQGAFPRSGWSAKIAKFSSILVHPENPNYSSIEGMLYSKDGKTLIACPSQHASVECVLPEGMLEILPGAFAGCGNIKKLVIASTVKTIGEAAFASMENLEEVVLPNELEYLGKRLFEGCKNLNNIIWPKNLRVIDEKCFYQAGIEDLKIPETVETIGSYAFAGIKAKSVTLPKTVNKIGLSIFAGVKKIAVYDTIDSDAKPAKDFLDDNNGGFNGRVGFIGIMQRENYIVGACNSEWREHTIIVRSSVDDSIKYSVRMPIGQKRKVYCTYASSWGRNAEFNFAAVDAIFKELTADAKLDYMFERLHYQKDITDDALNALIRYAARNAKDVLGRIFKDDDAEELAFLEPYGIVKKNTVVERLDQANRAGAVQCTAWLLEWQNNNATAKKKK